MNGWKEYRLAEIATIVDCEHKTAPLIEHGEYISVRTSNIENGRIDFDSANRVSYETYLEWTKRMKPDEGDIILAREAPVGEVGYVPKNKKVCLGQRTVLIKPNIDYIDSKYLLYYLTNHETKYDLISRSTGSVVEHLNVKDIKVYPLTIIESLPEQHSIASILSSLDDKIDLLHRQNKTLEALAGTLFRQWFVEEAVEGWETGKLGDYVDCINGYSYKSSELNPSKNALVTLKSFNRNGGFSIEGFKEFTGKIKPHQVVQEGDLVVAHTDITQEAEVIGNPALVIADPKFENLVISMDLVKVVPKADWISKEFTYFLMRSREFKYHCLGCANGTTVLHLNKEAIPSFEFKIPKKEKVIGFSIQAKELVQKIFTNHKQLRTLSRLRDTLLPKLMSGEVRIEYENN